jgi:hypothetical protein
MIAEQLPQPGAHQHQRGSRLLLVGCAITVLGAAISQITYLAATDDGGTFVVLIGPLLLGIALLVAGGGTVVRARGESGGRRGSGRDRSDRRLDRGRGRSPVSLPWPDHLLDGGGACWREVVWMQRVQ